MYVSFLPDWIRPARATVPDTHVEPLGGHHSLPSGLLVLLRVPATPQWPATGGEHRKGINVDQ
jgi:hypothetical protein